MISFSNHPERRKALKDFIRGIDATINTLRVFHQELKAEYDLVCKDDGSKEPQSGPASSKHVQRPHAGLFRG